MKHFSIYFLAFLTLWMSTWMVTDIHDVSISGETDSAFIFSEVHGDFSLIDENNDHNHDSHCGVCSYDHGGHVGQTLVTSTFVAGNIPTQHGVHYPLHFDLWYSRVTTPKIRPPIV